MACGNIGGRRAVLSLFPLLQTMHTHGVLRPEGVKLRVVKTSGRTLEDTRFHMEIRTQKPRQVQNKRYADSLSLSQSRLPFARSKWSGLLLLSSVDRKSGVFFYTAASWCAGVRPCRLKKCVL